MWKALSVTLWLSSTAAVAAGTESSGPPPTAKTTTEGMVVWNEPMPLLLTPMGYTGIAIGANFPTLRAPGARSPRKRPRSPSGSTWVTG